MDKRLDASRSGCREDVSGHSKKSKKRSSKRNSAHGPWSSGVLGPWSSTVQSEQASDAGMEYQHVLWQSNVQQNFPSNGQRLFAAASDPSMCGYAQMPMTYTMEPVSLPTMYRLYQPVPVSGVRTVHGRPRRHCNQNSQMNLSVNSMANGYTSLQENGLECHVPVNYQNGDYASLPPTANKNSEVNGDELNSEHRRYSDPGLASAEATTHTQSEDSDSGDSGSSITTIGRSNKLVLSLIEQMTELKKSNSLLFKELNETKSELGSMKAKLAQCKYSTSSDYQPGMLSDLIREIRQANKTCEEGLVTKVKSMVEEKLNQKSLEVVNLNNQVMSLLEEKEASDRRIAKLEEEVAMLKLSANNEGREIAAFEEEALALRRELQEARASKSLAECHAAKRVNGRPVTPVAFETAYVTSTPVRTALSDTCSLIPASSSSSSNPQSFASLLRPRLADLGHRLGPEKPSIYQATDCGSASDSWTDDKVPVSSTQPAVASNELEREDATLEETSSLTSSETPLDKESKRNSGPEEQSWTDAGEESLSQTRTEETSGSDKVDTLSNLDVETVSSVSERRSLRSESRSLSSEEGPRGSRAGSKRKKKRGSTKRSSEEKLEDKEGQRTVSADEDRLAEVDTGRAITEIPEVAVVGDGSFVPKDLCSTGILTSRVLTAPSRATYTTAYI